MTAAVRVWDLPTRLFHWLLVGLFGFSWWSAENHEMEWHILSGLTVLGLLAFRLIWGFAGGSTARFASFVQAPARVIAYLRGNAAHAGPGHNPLGGYSVLAMLALLALQVATGLFASDIDGLYSGSLSFLVSFDQSRAATEVHEVAFNLSMAVIALHVLAIAFYRVVKRRNLLHPMVTGRDTQLDPAHGELASAGLVRFIAALAIAVAVSWIVSKGLFL